MRQLMTIKKRSKVGVFNRYKCHINKDKLFRERRLPMQLPCLIRVFKSIQEQLGIQ